MGCIYSKNELGEIGSNLYKVDVVPRNGSSMWSGQLEITPEELTLYRRGKEPTKWSLKHLRRYGYEADLFTFEAGRRCTTGEGIYAFRCNQADQLFHILRSYIEEIPINDMAMGIPTSNSDTVDHLSTTINTLRQRQNVSSSRSSGTEHCISIHSSLLASESNYLEPTPNQHNLTSRQVFHTRLGSLGSGPLSPELESTDSLHSFTMIPEVAQNPNQTASNSNVYQEYPVKINEHNNNIFTKLSTDVPPENPAPIISGSNKAQQTPEHDGHMYENVSSADLENLIIAASIKPLVETPKQAGTGFFEESSRCYVNVDVGEIRPLVIRNRYSKSDIFTKVDLPPILAEDKSLPTTPVSKPETCTVNYIVLDLGDQSPSSQPNSTLALMTSTTTTCHSGKTIIASGCRKSASNHMLTKSLSTGSGISTTNSIQNAFNANQIGSGCLTSPESPKTEPFGYATIDFNKTVALSNSTAPSLKTEMKGIRRTRHSSCVGQSNSISD